YLGIEKVTSSPLPLSRGFVMCAHGRIPLPAPATLEVLRGVPVYSSGLQKEMVTPTGAAIIAALAESFVDVPAFALERVGYGAGTRVLQDRPNLLRLLLGEDHAQSKNEGTLLQVELNLDDLSPEITAFAVEQLFEAGAKDVWLTPIHMKKGRAAQLLGLLCERKQLGHIEAILFAQTSTLGFRYFPVERRILERDIRKVDTDFGEVSMKIGFQGDTIHTVAPEFEDCRTLAKEHDVPIKQVYAQALHAWNTQQK
ncbi:MAG TPA: TIGR00299 family protein, partial [Myxococcales bacterium]|nr:TIGR00299 family protein [Myxococcales bacterium]